MSGRATCSGSIILGSVDIPVKFYVAASSEKISFKMLSPESRQPVKQVLKDRVSGNEIQYSAVLQGYEYKKDCYLQIEDSDIKYLESDRDNSIEIREFVDFASIDLIHIEASYYLKPDKGGDKGYKLIAQQMKANNVVAIGTWAVKGKDKLMVIRPYKGGLICHELYFRNEIRDFEDNCANVEISDIEREVTDKLISKFSTGKFDSSKYRDQYSDRVINMVNAKVAGEQLKSGSNRIKQNMDLLSALQATLNE